MTTITITANLDTGYPPDAAARIMRLPMQGTVQHEWTMRSSRGVDTHRGELMCVAQRSWSAELTKGIPDSDLVEFMTMTDPDQVVLTADGRHAITTEWHQGEIGEIEGWVYVERWTELGREFHGYIDAVTRQLIQAG